MPEAYIIKRWDAEIGGYKAKWQDARKALSPQELKRAEEIIGDNVFDEDRIRKEPERVAEYLAFYLSERKEIGACTADEKAVFIERFEASCDMSVSPLCRELLAKC